MMTTTTCQPSTTRPASTPRLRLWLQFHHRHNTPLFPVPDAPLLTVNCPVASAPCPSEGKKERNQWQWHKRNSKVKNLKVSSVFWKVFPKYFLCIVLFFCINWIYVKSSASTRLVSQPANWPRFSLNYPRLLWSLLPGNNELRRPEVLRENPSSVVKMLCLSLKKNAELFIVIVFSFKYWWWEVYKFYCTMLGFAFQNVGGMW